LLVQELISREFERKLYLSALSYPRPRALWLLGRLAAIGIMALALLAVMSVLLAGLVHFVSGTYAQATPVSLGIPYIVTLIFAAADLMVVVALAVLVAVSTTTPSFVLIATLGFVIIARSYMPIIQLLQGADYLVEKMADPRLYKESLSLLNFVLPDLGTLDVRMIALYNKMQFLPPQWHLLLSSVLAYSVALIGLATWRLNTRQLN
jgi:Cu-processing system permease protein